jgi:hypothetical protein
MGVGATITSASPDAGWLAAKAGTPASENTKHNPRSNAGTGIWGFIMVKGAAIVSVNRGRVPQTSNPWPDFSINAKFLTPDYTDGTEPNPGWSKQKDAKATKVWFLSSKKVRPRPLTRNGFALDSPACVRCEFPSRS